MKREAWLGRAVIGVWLVIMWLLLWGDINLANVLGGIVVSVFLVWVFPPDDTNDDPIVVRPLKAIGFALWFAWALIITNVAVAKEVLLPSSRSDINPAVVACQLRTGSGRLATIVANAITLTPGTLTIDARNRPATLYVHVLAFESIEATRAEVADLERRVIEAFGTRAELALVAGPVADVEAAADGGVEP